MSAMQEYDVGPLNWVRDEIDKALKSARGRLAAHREDAGLSNALRLAQEEIHQAAGALRLVNLEGAAALLASLEALLAEPPEQACTADIAAAGDQALEGLQRWVARVAEGRGMGELALFPYYRRLRELQGAERVFEGELFFPDLRIRQPARDAVAALPAAEFSALVKGARAQFQRGLLAFLKGRAAGVPPMREAVARIHGAVADTAARSFWWACLGFLDSLAAQGIAADFHVKQLLARIDLQMRRLLEGAPQVAERLMRDALFFISKSRALAGEAQEIKRTFELDRYVVQGDFPDAETVARLRPLLGDLKEGFAQARQLWHGYAEGKAENLGAFRERVDALAQAAAPLGEAPAALLKGLGAAVAGQLSETLQLEVATTLLFLDNALDSEDILSGEFAGRAGQQTRRLSAAAAGEPLPAPTFNLLDAASQKAADRAVMQQLGQEIQASLKQMEEALDAYLRDPAQTAALEALPQWQAQIHGALAMLEQEAAAALLQAALAEITPHIQAQSALEEPVRQRLADALGSLNLFVEAHCAGRADAANILRPLLGEYGLAPAIAEPADEPFPSVEKEIPGRKAAVAAAYLGWHGSREDADAAKKLEAALVELGDDADLIADSLLKAQVSAALALWYQGPDEGFQRALEKLVSAQLSELAEPQAAPAQVEAHAAAFAQDEASGELDSAVPEEPRSAAAQPVAAPEPSAAPSSASGDAAVDAELLAIFLEEAQEVLAQQAEAVAACRGNPADKDALVVVRRAFHTLKGSSRMVGLAAFGEAAWGFEQFMNQWLAADKSAEPALLDLVSEANEAFSVWTGRLLNDAGAFQDMSALLARRFGESGAAEAPASAEVGAATAVVSPAETAEAPAEPELVAVGGIRLSPNLFDIFRQEAGQRVACLGEMLPHLEQDAVFQPDESCRRAVHTLSGIAGTTGFAHLANLAHALEMYWNAQPELADASARAGVRAVIMRLADMVQGITEGHREPQAADDMLALLNQLKGRLAPPAAQGGEPDVRAAPASIAEAGPESETLVAEAPEAPGALEEFAFAADAAQGGEEISAPPEPALDDEESPDLAAAASLTETEDFWALDAAALQDAAEASEPAAEPEPSAALEAEAQAAAFEAASQALQATPAPDVAVSPDAAAESAPPVFEQRQVQDELDADLLPVFLEEADTLVPEAAASLRSWKAEPGNLAPCNALRRALHTLKGGARMAGAMRLGELTHIMESQVIEAAEGREAPDASLFDALESRFDRLAEAVERLRHPAAAAPAAAPAPVEVAAVPLHAPAAAEAPAAAAQALMLRVRADWVDRMVNQAGEVSIARSRVETEMFALKRHVQDLADALQRLRAQLREVEIQAEAQMQASFQNRADQSHFDPLEFDRFTRFQEVTRFLAESVNDVGTVQQALIARLDATDAALIQQARLSRDLQQDLLRVRMMPLYSVSERLYRVVRQAARDLGKRAQLEIEGGELELDRSVLEKITAPLEHLLRNAVAHGLESVQRRQELGKPEFGDIRLIARQEGNEMLLILKDDGEGLNLERIRAKAVEHGLLSAGVEPSEDQLAQLIFAPGFSTADVVSEVAGRGVGMDVVKSEITALGGRLEVHSEAGRGAAFHIWLPLTLAVTQGVMVTAGRHLYALPATLVVQVQKFKPEHLAAALEAGAVEWRGGRYPLFYLPHLLGQTEATHEIARFNTVVLMKSGAQQAAFLVDSAEGAREVVVKNIGPQLARVTGIAGATVRGDGQVVLILNPVPLAQRALSQNWVAAAPAPANIVEEAAAPLVMVVDDSLTVRKITGRLLVREGYRVETAKDGVDALEKMNDMLPDAVLLDVEMPRMDGFELARIMRDNDKLRNVPIIMITSRTADKHRNHALEIGVNVYMGKPYQEAQLLEQIQLLLKATAGV